MLSKNNRVDKKHINRLFTEGGFLASPHLTFRYIHTQDTLPPRISFIAPKNVAKLAVKRNLLRRRGYKALSKYIDLFPTGFLGVFVFKKYQDDVSTLEDEIKKIYNTVH